MRRLGIIAALVCATMGTRLHADPDTLVRLDDGREVSGADVRRQGEHVVVETPFGTLRIPRERTRAEPEESTTAAQPAPPSRPPDQPRETTSPWFVIDSDLVDRRVAIYHEHLDAFVEHMVEVYGLDEKRLRGRAPFRMRVFRSREDFKRLQASVAPGIAEAKGRGFAEGVAGFYAPGEDRMYLWDDGPAREEEHPSTALHETTHLLNHHLSSATGIRFPVWFEEGTAVHFQTWTPGAEVPEPSLAALVTVVGDIEANKVRSHREVRSIAYADFRSPEYAWGWSLVHFLRHSGKGRRWAPLLEHLRTVGTGPPSDSENRRFLKAVGYRTDEALDEAWHAHVLAMKPEGKTPLGASPSSLADVAAIEHPTPEQATLFARIGRSFAGSGILDAAIVYLDAALRGGCEDAAIRLLVARAVAERGMVAEDEPWPEEAVAHVRRAVELDPLSARARLALGRQLLLRAETAAAAAAARDMLGLALLLAGPEDDEKGLAKWVLKAEVRAAPEREPKEVLRLLLARVPSAERALRSAWVYFLQEEQAWELLLQTLVRRRAQGSASHEEREVLAGLYVAGDRLEDAIPLYRALLVERPTRYYLWVHLIRGLAAAGRGEEARAAKAEALKRLDEAPRALAPLRRVVRRIRIP